MRFNPHTEIIKKLKMRLVDIAYRNKIGHLSSALTAFDIIYGCYATHMDLETDKFVLSQGHAGLALYCVLEYFHGIDAEKYYHEYNIHPHREPGNFIDVSTGSLGHGLPIAAGLALSDPNRKVWCLISDGECGEGSIWEALLLKKKLSLRNLEVMVNLNGSSAFGYIDGESLFDRLWVFDSTARIFKTTNPKVLAGVQGHYHILTKETKAELEYEIMTE